MGSAGGVQKKSEEKGSSLPIMNADLVSHRVKTESSAWGWGVAHSKPPGANLTPQVPGWAFVVYFHEAGVSSQAFACLGWWGQVGVS